MKGWDDYLLYCRGDEYEGGCEPVVLPRISGERFDITAAVGWSFDSHEGFWRCPACTKLEVTP